MIAGADVSHPSPNSTLPSVASVVASWDRDLSRYTACIGVQSPRQEIIEDLGNMFDVMKNYLLDVYWYSLLADHAHKICREKPLPARTLDHIS